MNRLRILVCVLLLFGSIAGALVSGIYLVVNVGEIPQIIIPGQQEVAKKAIPLEGRMEIIKVDWEKKEYISFLKHISLDLSGVTPLVLFLFFAPVSLNTFKIIKYRKKVEFMEKVRSDPTFPLQRGFEKIWIQLGFMGTLWGFMIIGLKMQKTTLGAGEEALDILVKAFGTALLSTFSAVFMVYIVGPSFKRFFRWAIGISVNQLNVGEQLTDKLSTLSARLQSTAAQIDTLKQKIEILNNEILSLSTKSISEVLGNFSSEMAGQHNELKMVRASLEEGVQEQKKLSRLWGGMSEFYEKAGKSRKEQHESLIKAIENLGQSVRKGFEDATKNLFDAQKLNEKILSSQINTISKGTKSIFMEFLEKMPNELKARIGPLHKKLDHIEGTINKLQVSHIQLTKDGNLAPPQKKIRRPGFFGRIIKGRKK